MSDKVSYVSFFKTSIISISTLSLLFIANRCSTKSPSHYGQVPTTLVLGLDGISYLMFKKMQDGGHFRNMASVAPMYASFPSISDPNWSAIYDLPPEPGFTKAFFDPTVKTKEGLGIANGSLASHWNRQPKYEVLSDYRLDGAWQHLSTYIWTETTAYYWLESLEKTFFEFRGRDTYFSLIINSDLLSHTAGERRVLQYLAKIDEWMDRIQKKYQERYGKSLEIIIVSDHGNSFLRGTDVPIEEGFKSQGWSLKPIIQGPKDVAYYVPEMLSFGAFYSLPESARDLAIALSKIPHVQTSCYAQNSLDVRVFSQGGTNEAQIIYSPEKDSVNYKVIKGKDPLINQVQYFKNGPLKALDYFTKSMNDVYPNSVVRIWEGLNQNSKIKPTALADPEYGYVFGNTTLRILTDIRGFTSTHGSLHRDQTMGIFVSNKRQLPPIRPQDFKQFVNVKDIGKFVN